MAADVPDSFDAEPDDLPPDTIEAYFIAQLRRMRVARDLSQARLGKLLNYSDGQVSMIEAGPTRPTLDFARRCDRFFDTGRIFTDLVPMMGRETLPAWYHRYTALEAQASAIQTCEVQLVPGLFQTAQYTRALFLTNWPRPSEEAIDARQAARLERQKILDRNTPPVIIAVLDESVLRRPVGGAEIMAKQLDHLTELAGRPNIRIHVLTYEQSARCHLDGPFNVLDLPNRRCVAFAPALNAGVLLAERRPVDAYTNRLRSILGEALSWLDSVAFMERLKRELYEHD